MVRFLNSNGPGLQKCLQKDKLMTQKYLRGSENMERIKTTFLKQKKTAVTKI